MNLAELDTAFLVPCTQCAELLQERERFCPYCGEEQIATYVAGAANSEFGGVHLDYRGGKSLSSMSMGFLGHVAPGRSGGIWPVRRSIGAGPAAQKDAFGDGGPSNWASGFATPNRLVIAITGALLLLLAFALVHDNFYLDKPGEGGRMQAFRSNVEQVQGALARGDLRTAERVLGVLAFDHARDPDVQALREVLEWRVQARTATRERLLEAGLKASKALEPFGLDAPPAADSAPALLPMEAPAVAELPAIADAPVIANAPPIVEAPMVAKAPPVVSRAPVAAALAVVAAVPNVTIRAPEIGAAAPTEEKTCGEALAALSLCQTK